MNNNLTQEMDLSNIETNNIEEHNMCDTSFVNIIEGILL